MDVSKCRCPRKEGSRRSADTLELKRAGGYLQREFSHADEVLCDLREALLALVHGEIWPVLELLVDLRKRLVVVPGQLDLLPQIGRAMSALNRLDVKEALAIVLMDGRVLRVCERARLAVAQARHVVLVAAEVLVIVVQLRLE